MNLSTRLTPSAGLLVLRIVVGVTFLLHGIDKLADLSGTEQFFASLDGPELVLVLIGASLAFVLAGAGRYSVDARLGL